ncbi:IS66 family insertion sequence element accessory protein TnpB [Ponticoccus litoralis]|uniref:IS66 family insertion sequence element accessory protein TnpB n=1 Tax=Ponticoccus litoralis TaxID=422297 RepID=A0AAW9SLH4_9RHOB
MVSAHQFPDDSSADCTCAAQDKYLHKAHSNLKQITRIQPQPRLRSSAKLTQTDFRVPRSMARFRWNLSCSSAAWGAIDMRKEIFGLSALAQDVLRPKRTSGALFAYRCCLGGPMKLLHWDGQDFCLYYKALARGRFSWRTPALGSRGRRQRSSRCSWKGSTGN